MASNQGSTMIGMVLEDVNPIDLGVASRALWQEVRNHGLGARCECPTIEALCKLYELGYRLVKDD